MNNSKNNEYSGFHVGLTGGIASGKTKVSNIFIKLGVEVIDTDHIAHTIVEPGNMALTEIVDAFGKEILTDSKQLNRIYMRDLIFNNPAKRKLLESIMHPKIQDEVEQQLSTSSVLYQIIVIPLLTSSPLRNQIDRILLVDCDVNTQLTRIMQRDGVTSELAKKIIASQSSRNERLAIAHDVIENNSSFEQILPQVKKFHERYLRLAKK